MDNFISQHDFIKKEGTPNKFTKQTFVRLNPLT